MPPPLYMRRVLTPSHSHRIKRLTQSKKQKERERKELEQMNRKHLANMRVVQKNLVYVVGLSPKLAREEVSVCAQCEEQGDSSEED